ncbi:hypothetical protein EIN_318640 [Entamoeba invadens IP1]|uniref:Uncharacterized protein n=1 Tax=Entamoeba invadens IP1 TaxID=370355 RepID=A0A0A1TZI0_ENTIV|nr:hypothetical protein EIN_318640 [Entamoeba invadens IP1]ELP87005.1 hypothetical protein EIN_318640 [Entamoeba invadens IP1]|eukprot:XP_004253776.1 hypothetical protein EIN_318640 [Entamoeba invadens IP1]
MNDVPVVYTISPFLISDFVLDICGGGDYERSPLVITTTPTPCQYFELQTNGNILCQKTGMVLFASNEDDPTRYEVLQCRPNLSARQLWDVRWNNRKGCTIWSVKYPTLCMTIEDGQYSDDTSIVLQPYDKSVNQHFILTQHII